MYNVPAKGRFNDYIERTYGYFYSKFLNEFLLKDIDLSFNFFNQRIENNISIIFLKFCKLFPKFDVNFKVFYY